MYVTGERDSKQMQERIKKMEKFSSGREKSDKDLNSLQNFITGPLT